MIRISVLFIAMFMIQLFITEQQVLGISKNLENVPKQDNPDKPLDRKPVFDSKTNNVSKPQDKDFANISQTPIKRIDDSFDKNTMPEEAHPAENESSTLTKSVIVIVTLTMIVFLFLAIRVFRAPRNPNVIVKKYGVRARRCDVEMEPLPLDDEEDETIFELGNFTRH